MGLRVWGTLCLGLAPPFSPGSLSLALITDLEQLSVRLTGLSEGSPGPPLDCVGFHQPTEMAPTYLPVVLEKKKDPPS